MDYFKILNLNREPFSNSPDPDFFFRSGQHHDCLQKLEIALRLRRGLNVVVGDVGTGKTTLCRQLIRRFAADTDVKTHLILDPYFPDASEFLSAVAEMFDDTATGKVPHDLQAKETIKQYLYKKSIEEKKTVVLIIDEGQKIPVFCLEILREFLNYETNENKLLQIVIFAQSEFDHTLSELDNFSDRINLYHELKPLNFRDTKMMIQYRLEQSSDSFQATAIFSYSAVLAIYVYTGGYPRKIVNLCHSSILAMIIQNRTRAGWFSIRSCARRLPGRHGGLRGFCSAGIAAACAILLIALFVSLMMQIDLGERLLISGKTMGHQVSSNAESMNPKDIPNHSKTRTMAARSTENQLSLTLSGVNIQDDGSDSEDLEMPLGVEEKVIVMSPPDLQKDPALSEKKLPVMLGRVAIKEQETLGEMIRKIYGTFTPEYLNAVINVNQHIINPDMIKSGMAIYFPAVAAEVKYVNKKSWFIKLEEKDRLNDAYDFMRFLPPAMPPVRIIPHWDSRTGLKIDVLLKEYFDDEITARNRKSGLHPAFIHNGKVVPLKIEDTVFYSDPFL